MFAPDPMISGHKNLEGKDCLRCHDAGKGISTEKCLSCHKDIKPFIKSQTGFHGLASKTQTCIQCHTDHKGRKHDTTVVNVKKFEHTKLTGYELVGKHAKIKCEECHKEKRTHMAIRPQDIRYSGMKGSSCRSCHNKDDIHFFKGPFAKKDCNSCHDSLSWKQGIGFNHDTDTNFKLVEKHRELKCNDCHLKNKANKEFRYRWENLAKKQCLSCHENFHKNRLGPKFSTGECTTCHTQTKWTIENFDHQITGYKLNGKHADVQCIDCHIPHLKKPSAKLKLTAKEIKIKDLNFTGLKQECLSCHADFHKFGATSNKILGNLNQCSKCHEESSWTKTHSFNHDTHTSYPLDGKHLDLKCADCHMPQSLKANRKTTLNFNIKKPTYHWDQLSTKTCETCHKNPHIGQFSKELSAKKCTLCHVTESWSVQKSDSAFDHNKTRFALDGAHKGARCNDCHGDTGHKKFKFKSVESKFCIECHQDIHERQFSANFSTKNCSECHSTDKFKPLKFFDHNRTNYQLKGQHEKLQCSDCHKPSPKAYSLTWPNVKTEDHKKQFIAQASQFQFANLKEKSCSQCHMDYHKGQLSQNCQQCHNENSWKSTTFNHNKQSRFPLAFKHAELKCEKCHFQENTKTIFKNETKPLVRYKPIASQCVDCHKDPHKGNFGKTCQECHSEKSWSATKDFHKNFTLSGVHYTLECSECHTDRKKLTGFSQKCILCHQKDDVHNGSLPNCNNCHTQHFWEVTSFRHSLTRFALRGAHRVIECTECHNNGIYKGLNSSCVSCHLGDFQANPAPHSTGNTDCIQCHRNTFTFKKPR
ncbi:MAG: hypothetical protein ACXVCA_02495 [Bdellovibrio sp.]